MASEQVEIRPGETALAPKVDDPQGFAAENRTERSLTVSFRFDVTTHVMTVVIEKPHAYRQLPGEASTGGYVQSSPDQPV